MQCKVAMILLLLSLSAVAEGATLRVSPVGNVVDLMKSVEAKVQEEADLEEDMFENYTCWSKRTNNAKREAIAAAQARIKMLTQRISELKSMKGSESGEAEKLLAQLNEVNSEINATETQRDGEAKANEENIETTTSAVNGLEEAKEALGTVVMLAKKGKKQSLLSLRGSKSSAGLSSKAMAKKASDLEKALQLAEKRLSTADGVFLRRILTADVSNVKKGNGKEDPPEMGAVSEDYVARSGDILGTLDKLSGEFSTDLESTKKKEASSKETFLKLMKEKNIEKSNVEEAVRNQEREKQAREYKTKEAEKEIASLEEQIATDEEFIAAVDKAQDQKQEEWDQRSKVRSEELTAIAKAIETLHSDEARDLFNSNFNSFIQKGASYALALQQAGNVLSEAFKSTKDSRILALSLKVASSKANSNGHFDGVFTKIDEMIKVLDEEEASDSAKKKECEDDLEQDTADVKETKEDIAHLTNEITNLNEDVEEIKTEIMNKKREIAEIANELSESKKIREAEATEAVKAKEEDDQAMATIETAEKLIADFYSSNAALLQQKQGAAEPDLSAAPGTWSSGESYHGDQKAGGRISALFEEVKSDLKKDMASAALCEENAQKMYEDAKSSLEKQTSELNGEIDALMSSKGDKKTSASNKESETETQQGELKALQKKMADVKPECDFFVDKYDARNKNRETEKTSLNKAKEILQKYDA